MAAPTMTKNQTLRSSASLGASATATADLDITTKWEAQVQVEAQFGTVAATNGLRITVWRNTSTSARWDTEPVTQFDIPGTASTTKRKSFVLPTGHYRVEFRNLDGTNAITAVDAIYATVDSVE